MEYVKLLLLSMSLIAGFLTSQIEARHHGRFGPQRSDDIVFPAQHPGRGHGVRGGFQGDTDYNIPGLPMKGPPSAPYVFPPQQQQQPTNIQNPGINGYQSPRNNYRNNNSPIYVNNPYLLQGNNQQPKQFEQLQNYPAIEPVTNELPQPSAAPTTSPTINPRELDLLYGSNLYEEDQKAALRQGNPVEPDFSIDDRMLLETGPRCKEGYRLMGSKCRLMV